MRSRHKTISDRVRRRRQRDAARRTYWQSYQRWLAAWQRYDSPANREYYQAHIATHRGKVVSAA